MQVLQKMCRKTVAIHCRKYAETLQNRIPASTRNKAEITEDNTVKTRGNRSTNIGKVITAKNKEEINQRLRSQRQRKIGAWDQDFAEKVETSLVAGGTFCGIPTVKT